MSAESVGVNRLATPPSRPTGKAGTLLLYFPVMEGALVTIRATISKSGELMVV